MPEPIDAVLFDFAGTLFAPREAVDWVAAAADRMRLRLGEPEVAALAARYLDAGLPGGPYPDDVPAALAGVYAERDLRPDAHRTAYVGLLSTVAEPRPGFAEALYGEILRPEGWRPYADTHDVVGALVHAGIRVGVVSNVGFDLRPILRDHGLDELADACTLSYEHGAAKPDRRLFEAAMAAVGASPATTLMVGDHPEADAGAAALGSRTLLLPMSAPGTDHGLEHVLQLVL